MKSQSASSKAFRKSTEITEKGLLYAFERSTESRIIENVCNITTDTASVFHVETTWKRLFQRGIHVVFL